MVAMVTSPSFLRAWNILPFLFLYLCIRAHYHQKLMSENQLCDYFTTKMLRVSMFSDFPPSWKNLQGEASWSTQQHEGGSPPCFLQMSEPPHGQKLWQLQPCCSVTTQRSSPNVSVGTLIDWKIISLTTRVRPILHRPSTPSPGVQTGSDSSVAQCFVDISCSWFSW